MFNINLRKVLTLNDIKNGIYLKGSEKMNNYEPDVSVITDNVYVYKSSECYSEIIEEWNIISYIKYNLNVEDSFIENAELVYIRNIPILKTKLLIPLNDWMDILKNDNINTSITIFKNKYKELYKYIDFLKNNKINYIDFHDGNVLYDEKYDKLVLCDYQLVVFDIK